MSLSTERELRCSSVRSEIQDLAILDEADPLKRFFPVDKIRSCLTRNKVSWLLNCACSKCKKEYALFRRKKPPTEFLDRIVGSEDDPESSCNPSNTAFTLLALLIYAEHPLLIPGFLMRDFYDASLPPPASFSKQQLRAYCPEFALENERDFNKFVSEFLQLRPQFAIPRMDSGMFIAYGPDTILPFIREQKIGARGPNGIIQKMQSGASGRIYKFEIYEEYCNFQSPNHYTQFARKELVNTNESAFLSEVGALDVANALQDDHIVRKIKAYKLGDTFNLIFPLAKANLDQSLRDPILEFDNLVHGPLESRPAWKQVLGIAIALGKLGAAKGSNSRLGTSGQHQFYGGHFDLKPTNILIDDDDNWIISDYGQATLKPTGRTSSRVVNQGGSDAYAPPEIDNLTAQFSHRYDVWSLGCILLEVTAFVMLGYDGLTGCKEWKGLDQVRCTGSAFNTIEDNLFYSQEWYHGEYTLKKGIVDFISFLTGQSLVHEQRTRVFLSKVLDLILRMLEPKAERRIDIEEVISCLSSAIEEARNDAQGWEGWEVVAESGERPIGEPELSKIRLLHRRKNIWMEASVHAFESLDRNLRIYTISNKMPIESLLVRSRVQLVPNYAFQTGRRKKSFSNESAIAFSDISQEGCQIYPGLSFSFPACKDMLIMQAKFTQHKIESSFVLENITYRRHRTLTNRISSMIHIHDSKNYDFINMGPGLVQLWSENVNEARPRTRHREVPPRRMVIFIQKTRTMMTIPMGRNWRETEQSDAESNTLQFSPANMSFAASTIHTSRPEDPNSFPGIPLCPKILRAMEYYSRIECDLVQLTFLTPEKRKKFAEDYRYLRKCWYDETVAMEKQHGYYRKPQPLAVLPPAPKSKQPDFERPGSWALFRSGSVSPQVRPLPKEDPKWRPSPHMGGSRGGSRKATKSMVQTSSSLLSSKSSLRTSSRGSRAPMSATSGGSSMDRSQWL
ncbi:hypothetical protein LZ554_009140 [Drepanopeziza brunnea f. sp. 'monogermtubi']|nr:hypothetical protein LZ554_009140 [Drepanopeziza brunnea f. sp. 'monogermtubi']